MYMYFIYYGHVAEWLDSLSEHETQVLIGVIGLQWDDPSARHFGK